MKKYSLITLLSLSFSPYANAQTTQNVDEYYKSALESRQQVQASTQETAESIYASTTETTKKIEEIRQEIEKLKLKTETKPEEMQALRQELQTKLSLLQTQLQTDTLKLQYLTMLQAKNSKTKEELHEETTQGERKKIQDQLAEKEKKLEAQVERSNVRL
ncbi:MULTISPECIES: type IV secretion system protein VirB5 [unclassified Bartonella]|uniref:type IV secretion system protein VirB5 n=1 Tax=unclassified Bartonella TaxID=2645622 RepID=UPI00235E85A6|nr:MULTISPECIES: type IV secretion system protein VirB5 [unclassified Bartonella]